MRELIQELESSLRITVETVRDQADILRLQHAQLMALQSEVNELKAERKLRDARAALHARIEDADAELLKQLGLDPDGTEPADLEDDSEEIGA